MGLRAFKRGVIIATRTKKTIVFIIIFAALITLSIQSTNSIHTFDTDRLMEIRGYIFTPKQPIAVQDFENITNEFHQLIEGIKGYARGIYVIYVADIELSPRVHIGVLWIRPYDDIEYPKEMPWIVEEIKPTKIVEGRTLDFSRYKVAKEAVVSEDFAIMFPLDDKQIQLTFETGILRFSGAAGETEINVVGKSSVIFDTFRVPGGLNSSSLMFVTYGVADDLEDKGFITRDNKYIAKVIVTVKGGDVFSPWNIGEIEENKDKIESVIEEKKPDWVEMDRPSITAGEYLSLIHI